MPAWCGGRLGSEVEGYLRASEFSRDRVEDLTQHLKGGQVIETMIINVDRKTRSINLSIKAKDQVEQNARPCRSWHRTVPPAAARPIWARCSRPSSTSNNRKFDMTKSELIARLAERFPQLVAKDADYAVKMILDALTAALVRGDRIEIRGFGSFALNYRPPRVGRNPKSGDKVQVPEKYVPHFKAGKELRERVDYSAMSQVVAACFKAAP
jgi:integration host factor subunit beta